MSYLPGKFIWFELATPDVAKARAFYEPLFGWHVENMPMGDQPYPIIHNGSQGIGGLAPAKAGERSRWISYISVLDVDKTWQAALSAGAQALSPPTDYGPVGRGAAIVDPTGAAVSLWHSNEADRPDPESRPFGDWYWDELWTHDAKKAVAFYEKVFGYTHEEMKVPGQQTPYLILNAGGKGRGGVFQATDKSVPTQWVPYVGVADCDATVAKAAQLGATVCMSAMDIANVGRVAAVVDPQGATIAFIQPAPGM